MNQPVYPVNLLEYKLHPPVLDPRARPHVQSIRPYVRTRSFNVSLSRSNLDQDTRGYTFLAESTFFRQYNSPEAVLFIPRRIHGIVTGNETVDFTELLDGFERLLVENLESQLWVRIQADTSHQIALSGGEATLWYYGCMSTRTMRDTLSARFNADAMGLYVGCPGLYSSFVHVFVMESWTEKSTRPLDRVVRDI